MDSAAARPADADGPLLRRFLAGEAEACRQVERWAHEVLRYHPLGLSREEREDAVQDVLAHVWRAVGRPGFELRHGLRALVRTVTLARAIDRVRRRRPQDPIDETLPDRGSGPDVHAEIAQESSFLHAALAGLDAPCRDIIRLHYFEDWPYARIAEREHRRESTMRVRMFHCLRALRASMGAPRAEDAT